MIEKQITIVNKLGLHARAATKFVNLASRFRSQIQLCYGAQHVNGKSIMGVLTLGATKGTTLLLTTNGPDEHTAMADLQALVQNRFGEAD